MRNVETPDDNPETRRRELGAMQLRQRQKMARRAAWDYRDDEAVSPGAGGPKEGSWRWKEPDLHKRRRIEMDKLDTLDRSLFDDLNRTRPMVVRGRVVIDPSTGEPLIDRGADLAVADRILRVADRRAKVRGIDAPRRREVQEMTGDQLVDEIDRMRAEIDTLEAAANEEPKA